MIFKIHIKPFVKKKILTFVNTYLILIMILRYKKKIFQKKATSYWKLRILCFVFIFVGISTTTYGQFTYLEGGFGLNTYKSNKSILITSTPYVKYTNLDLHLAANFRIVRFFGIGVQVGIPVYQKSKFDFNRSERVDYYHNIIHGVSFPGFEYVDAKFKPKEYNYELKQSASVAISGRFYVDKFINSYIDVRLSIFNLSENFTFVRDSIQGGVAYDNGGQPIWMIGEPAWNVHDKINRLQIIPGFSIGASPRIWKNLFVNINVGLNIFLMKKASFDYYIPYEYQINYISNGNSTALFNYLHMRSPLAEKVKAAFNMNFGIGYVF